MKKKIMMIIGILILVIIITFIVVINLSLGYDIENIIYDNETESQTIKLGVPKLSFMKSEDNKNYYYKNFRKSKILEKEMQNFLGTLEKNNCSDAATYYYDKDNDFTVIDYGIKNNTFYSTIFYKVEYGNYCFTLEKNDYSKKMNGLFRYHSLNDDGYRVSEDGSFKPRLVVLFLDSVDNETLTFKAQLHAYYVSASPSDKKKVDIKELETSSGVYEIKKDNLYYTRTKIEQASNDINVPETSVFGLSNGMLILKDNYLNKYEEVVILK